MLTKRSSAHLMKQDMRGHDFSGTDLSDLKAKDYNFFEAIFGGCNIRGWRVAESIFQHTDFAESRIDDCRFEESSFDHSDFVGSEIRDCVFRRCSFQNAEWRDVTFLNVQFQQCVFRNTTTSLARFVDCEFDRSSSSSFVGSSKRYNTFARSFFHLPADEVEFLKLNFGIRAAGHHDAIDVDILYDPLFSAAVDYYNGTPIVGRPLRKLLNAIESMAVESPPQSLFRLKYAIDICRLLIDVDEISILATQYIHDRVHELLSRVRDSAVLLELVAVLALLRLKLREKIAFAEQELAGIDSTAVGLLRCHFEFEMNYPRDAVDDFAVAFAVFCNHNDDAMRVDGYRTGSTIFDILTELATPIIQGLRLIYYYLPKATVTVESAAKLKEASTALMKRQPKSSERRVSTKTSQSSKKKGARKNSKREIASSGPPLSSTALTIPASDVLAPPTGEAKEVQVIVRVARERVIAMGGRVEVHVLLQ